MWEYHLKKPRLKGVKMALSKEFLKTAGLTDEQIDAIFVERGKEITAEKEKFEQLQKNYTDATEQLKKANETINGFGNIDAIKADVEKYRVEAEKAKADHENYIKQQEFDKLLETGLSGAKAKNLKAVKALLDIDALKGSQNINDDLTTQLEKIKTDNDYLFDGETVKPTITSQTNNKSVTIDDRSKIREVMGLPPLETEQKK